MNLKTWKVQKFFGDIVYDLRSRGLLPVVILLLVAMVAVPMLISRGSSGGTGSSLQQTGAAVGPAPEGQHAVVSYSPGIRNYKKRLNDLSPKDPFRQPMALLAAASSASNLSSTVTSTTSGSSVSTSSGTSTLPATVGGSTGSGGKKKKHKKSAPTAVSYQVNILAGDVTTTLTPFNNVASMTQLPSQATPVVIFWGLTPDYSQAMFLVSNKVGTVTGPGTCVPAPDDCALLSLKAGESEDLPFSQDGKTYRIVVAQISRASG